jgi:hypothetical protein
LTSSDPPAVTPTTRTRITYLRAPRRRLSSKGAVKRPEILASAGPYKGPPRLTSSRLIPTIHLSKNIQRSATIQDRRVSSKNACNRSRRSIRNCPHFGNRVGHNRFHVVGLAFPSLGSRIISRSAGLSTVWREDFSRGPFWPSRLAFPLVASP